jgi:hypothetical protein
MNTHRLDLYDGEKMKCDWCHKFIEFPHSIFLIYDDYEGEVREFICPECLNMSKKSE